jgi:alpha-galactosidase
LKRRLPLPFGAFRAFVLGLSTLHSPLLAAEGTIIATTPPMGWNSWDSYGTAVREPEVKANAAYMAKHLASHGWQYIVVDIQWYEPNAAAHGYRPNAALTMDQYGRLTPAVNRFPSAAGDAGFKPLADYVHSLGLKFGIHILRGIPRQAVRANTPVLGTNVRASDIADRYSTCPWNGDMYGVDMSRKGAQAYYDSIVQMYADWGMDFIKADDEARPIHREEIAALHKAIEKTHRPIVLSLSPGPARVVDAQFLATNAQMWRVSDDFWDDWKLLRQNFMLLGIWGGVGHPGAWPDGDMLPLGRIGIRAERGNDRMTRFTKDEQRTLVTLWSIAQSPLIFGGDLPSNDEYTNSLITNDEVVAVNQKGSHPKEVFTSGNQVAWTSNTVGLAAKNLAVFNIGDREAIDIRVDWRSIGLPSECNVRDLWANKDLGRMRGGETFHLAPHASALYRVSPAE